MSLGKWINLELCFALLLCGYLSVHLLKGIVLTPQELFRIRKPIFVVTSKFSFNLHVAILETTVKFLLDV